MSGLMRVETENVRKGTASKRRAYARYRQHPTGVRAPAPKIDGEELTQFQHGVSPKAMTDKMDWMSCAPGSGQFCTQIRDVFISRVTASIRVLLTVIHARPGKLSKHLARSVVIAACDSDVRKQEIAARPHLPKIARWKIWWSDSEERTRLSPSEQAMNEHDVWHVLGDRFVIDALRFTATMRRDVVLLLVFVSISVTSSSRVERTASLLRQGRVLDAVRHIRDEAEISNDPSVLMVAGIASLEANSVLETSMEERTSGVDFIDFAFRVFRRASIHVSDHSSKKRPILELLSDAARLAGRWRETADALSELASMESFILDVVKIRALAFALGNLDTHPRGERTLETCCETVSTFECAEAMVMLSATRMTSGALARWRRKHQKWVHHAQALHGMRRASSTKSVQSISYDRILRSVQSFASDKSSFLINVLSTKPLNIVIEDFVPSTKIEIFARAVKREFDALAWKDETLDVPVCFGPSSPPTQRGNRQWFRPAGRASDWLCTDTTLLRRDDLNLSRLSESTFILRDGNYDTDLESLKSFVHSNVHKLFGVPPSHALPMQLLQYAQGTSSSYATHTDCSGRLRDSFDRAFTALLYLTTSNASLSEQPSSGSTNFPLLNASIRPVRGRLVFFSSIDDDGVCDPMSVHESVALDEDETVKMVVQQWYARQPIDMKNRNAYSPLLQMATERAGSDQVASYVSCDGRGCRRYSLASPGRSDMREL